MARVQISRDCLSRRLPQQSCRGQALAARGGEDEGTRLVYSGRIGQTVGTTTLEEPPRDRGAQSPGYVWDATRAVGEAFGVIGAGLVHDLRRDRLEVDAHLRQLDTTILGHPIGTQSP